MTWMTAVYVVTGVALVTAGSLATYRLIAGRNSLDRLVAVDMLVAIIICGLCAWIAFTLDSTIASAVVSLALLNFIGGVAIARYRVRDTD